MEAQNKTFNNGILLQGVLIPKLLNKPIIFCSNYFWVNVFSIFSTLHAIRIHLIIIKLIVNLLFV